MLCYLCATIAKKKPTIKCSNDYAVRSTVRLNVTILVALLFSFLLECRLTVNLALLIESFQEEDNIGSSRKVKICEQSIMTDGESTRRRKKDEEQRCQQQLVANLTLTAWWLHQARVYFNKRTNLTQTTPRRRPFRRLPVHHIIVPSVYSAGSEDNDAFDDDAEIIRHHRRNIFHLQHQHDVGVGTAVIVIVIVFDIASCVWSNCV